MSTVLDRLYDLAERQLGYFTATQAQGEGASHQLLRHHLQASNIQRVSHGIYRLTNYPAQAFEDVMVAVLWAGSGAAASHETALAIYGIGDAMPPATHITVPHKFRGKRQGVIVHTNETPTSEITKRNDVPVTTVERTLIDVAETSDRSLVQTALQDALRTGATTQRRLKKTLAEHTDETVLASLLKGLV